VHDEVLDRLSDALNLPVPVVVVLIVLSLAQIALQIAALIDLARRDQVAFNRKWVWVLIILFVSTGIGAILYFAVGRQPQVTADADDSIAGQPEAVDRARRAVELLYGRETSQVVDSGVAAIEICNLSKRFGTNAALDSVTLSVPQGSVYGFLGPNGAGKSTGLNILAGLSLPTSGSATIFGQDVVTAGNDVRAVLGYLPDVPGFYGWMTGEEFLRFSGKLFGLEGTVLDERVEALLDLAGLTGVETRVGGYSRGMKQRLGIAQALINAPKLLMLDEPTSALDPVGRKAVLDMISALAGRTTVFFSTHILVDVERVCDTVAILNQGKLLVESPIGELRAQGGAHSVVVEMASTREAEQLATKLVDQDWLGSCTRVEDTLHIAVTNLHEAQREIPALVAADALAMQRMESGEASLEDVFIELVGGGGQA
jgi:ABC-2 type transport system ATP-binding protein